MSNMVDHAKRELEIIGETDEVFKEGVLKIIKTFADMGHSGCSASIAIAMIVPLLEQKNLAPLTDDPNEWFFHGKEISPPNGVWQNIRNSEAFSHDGGKTYYLLSEGGNESSHRDGTVIIHFSRPRSEIRVNAEGAPI